ncbi:MAG: transcription-repair coupling factor [Gammaproteobacteria bacterium]|nr:transcription-repair coupling factor [Gammaproteobacteria bacterium]
MSSTAVHPCSVLEPPLPEAAGTHARWSRLYGAARSMALAAAATRAARPFVVVTADASGAMRLEQELAFFAPGLPLLALPDWETLPYDRFSPYQDITSERIATLSRLPQLDRGVVIVAASTALHRLAPRAWLEGRSFSLRAGETLDRDAFRRRLEAGGYRACAQVGEHGDFAVRGSLIDVFPMGAEHPFRIDLFDDEIETLRLFDIDSQRSTDTVERLELLPAREFPLDEAAIREFRRAWRLEFEGNRAQQATLYQDVSEGLAPAGIEYYLPLFFDELDTLAAYLPANTVVVFDEGVAEGAAQFEHTVAERYEALRHDVERPLCRPSRVFATQAELEAALAPFTRIDVGGLELAGADSTAFASRAPVRVPVDARAAEPFALLTEHVRRADGRVLFLADSLGRRETLLELFREQAFRPRPFDSFADFLAADHAVGIAVGAVAEGAELEQPRLSLLTEAQLFGERAQQRRRRRTTADNEAVIRNLTELTAGAPVVHEHHGVGRYRGLEVLTVGGITNEFIKIEYADGDNLYVPVSALDLISRYSGVDPDHAPLHKLGSGQWDKARRKAAEKIRDVAAELLELHARRAARRGHAFKVDSRALAAFEQGFPFEETADQLDAVAAVVTDMGREQPMDRLICGDVGFGKTEVAMRAAFVAINDGYQVAILVPTTLLAGQHYETLRDRFADWPVRIEQLSRFRDAASTRATLEGLRNGTVDIVVGTHKLLGKQVKFKNLGLLVVDEEHRFGVRQKEQIKALRADVDILTLTATPIPRTLNMALSGTRELSIIATPPQKRLAIKTFVREWADALLREAILREIGRGGQVYFVHNEVENIQQKADELAAIVPEARIAVAHGQMRESTLERVMLDFYHGRCNVLVCTTIIETGIDVPNANTMIINRADKFGLAQLYQLRGRVGRSHHRAYAYLVVPHRKAMTQDAVKRLEAIESLEELGVGFTLATHDLEIRGAGEILGDEQSGHIQEIGFGLYSELLNRTVSALKAGRGISLDDAMDARVEVELHIAALLPEDYLPDVHARLILYKRIASARSSEELADLREEIIDRFGTFGAPVDNLFRVTSFKLDAERFGIRRIDLGSRGGRIEFHAQPNVDPMSIIELVQTDPDYRFDGGDKLRVVKELPDAQARFEELRTLFDRFSRRHAAA